MRIGYKSRYKNKSLPSPASLVLRLEELGYDLLDVITISLIKYKKAALAPNNAGRHISNSLQTWKCGTFHIIGGM